MTPGIAPPMTLPLSTVSQSTGLPSISPPLIPSAPSPIGRASTTISPVQSVLNQTSSAPVTNGNTPALVSQVAPPPKPVLPAAPSRKFANNNFLFVFI